MLRARRILVAVDLSEASRVAFRQARRVAAATRARLEVLHVVDRGVMAHLEETVAGPPKALREQTIAGARMALAKWLAGAGAPADLPTTVVVGSPEDEIRKRVKRGEAEAVVLGVRGANAPEGHVGSVALRSLHAVPADLLFVRGDVVGPYRRVVACCDLGAAGDQVVRHAAAIARLDGAALDLVHGFAPPWGMPIASVPLTPEPAWERRYRGAIEQTLEAMTRRLGKVLAGLRVTPVAVEGRTPSDALLAHLHATKADLVVVGSSGHSRLVYALVGSTAERIVREAPCAVLAIQGTRGVRAKKAAPTGPAPKSAPRAAVQPTPRRAR